MTTPHAAARDPATDAEALVYLATDADPRVRALVVNNPSTPQYARNLRAFDIDPYVRMAVASSDLTHPGVLRGMALDTSNTHAVRCAALDNPNYPKDPTP